jgi:hypothetical protein
MSIRSDIVDGIAEILWAEGWMNHVEEHGCERIGGVDIIDVMPPIPKDARDYAEKWASEVEKMNGKKLDALYEEAMEANVREGGEAGGRRSSPEAFGNNLAYMIQGSGSSWFDYNAEFDLEYPDHSAGSEIPDLMYLAGSKCKAAWENPPCEECGAFSRPGKTKCSNCGTPFEFEEED